MSSDNFLVTHPDNVDEWVTQREEQKDSGKAMRFNADKVPMEHIFDFPFALMVFAKNCDNGAKKYDLGNFRKGTGQRELAGCAMRHMFAYMSGMDMDKSDQLHHLSKAMWNIMCMIENSYWNPKGDDRLKFAPEIAEMLEAMLAGEFGLDELAFGLEQE